MGGKIKSYRDLDVWKLGMEIVDDTYRLTIQFPREEKYGLGSAMERSSVSIPSNIAEGFGRLSNKDYRRFCSISMGSCAELDTQTEIAARREYITETERDKHSEKLDHESRMLRNLMKRLSER